MPLVQTRFLSTTYLHRLLLSAASSGDRRLLALCHSRIITSGNSQDLFLANNLITFYGRSNSLISARQLFDRIPNKDSVTYNSLLSAYASNGQTEDALFLFRLMLRFGVAVTPLSFTPVLKECSFDTNLVGMSRAVHGVGFRVGIVGDSMVGSSLVGLYAKFGFVGDARRVFDEMGQSDRDSVLWNIMIKSYCRLGLESDAFLLFSEMWKDRTLSYDDGLNCFLMGSASGRNLEQAKAVGVKVCLFDNQSDAIAWNKRMSEYLKDGRFHSVLDCFVEMRRLSMACDNITFVCVLSATASVDCVEVGEQIHCAISKLGFCGDVSVSNSLIKMYSSSAHVTSARNIFDEMEPDLISWNSMISIYTRDGMEEESLQLLLNMMKNGVVPDEFSFASILRACSSNSFGQYFSRQIHCCIAKMGLDTDAFVHTGLVDVYAKNGSMEEAESLIAQINCVDLGCCNALISGYVTIGNDIKALDFFVLMLANSTKEIDPYTLTTVVKACSNLVSYRQGKEVHAYALKFGHDSDICVSSGILDMYLNCGDVKSAFAIFSSISNPDEVVWTSMIYGCIENGDEEHGFALYLQMIRSGIFPDNFTMASLIKACSCLAALDQGRQLHATALKMSCLSDPYVGTSIVDMYAKCGNLKDSYSLFNKMSTRNLSTWNAMVVALAQHGNGELALRLFDEMKIQGFRPDKITFLGVISACSHSGMVSEAYFHFQSMFEDYGIVPDTEHCSCLIDALSRTGFLTETEEVIESMPFEASASMYKALLGACRNKDNTEIGSRVAKKLLNLEPRDPSAYILLSNIYAATHQWSEVGEARKMMRQRGVKKDPGYSWVEVNNKVHMFVVDDRSHPQVFSIYETLEDLMGRIKDEGCDSKTHFSSFCGGKMVSIP